MTPSRLLLAALDRATPDQRSAAEPPHICARCSTLEETIRKDVPHWRPGTCESWVGTNGRRYWSGLCAQCAELERNARINLAVGQGMSRDVAERKFGIARTRPGHPAGRDQVG